MLLKHFNSVSMAEILIYIQEKRKLIKKKLKHDLFKNKHDKGAYNKTQFPTEFSHSPETNFHYS